MLRRGVKIEHNMVTVAKLYSVLKAHYYWFSHDEQVRRFKLTEELLEPYRMLGDIISQITDELGDSDVFDMLDMYGELD